MVNEKERAREFLIDNISRSAQVIFTALVVGPFISGFNMLIFFPGCVIFALLLLVGIYLASNPKE